MIVHQRAQEIVRRRNRVQIARKMQIDVRHGHHLRVAAARRAALYPKYRPQRRLPQGEAYLFSQLLQPVGKPDGNGRFPFNRTCTVGLDLTF